jgi:EAL domain-containing protein (putative c-di-GMP-specific phosphodiesterase class I)
VNEIAGPDNGRSAALEQTMAETDLVAAMLARYGLDARARSALKAYFRNAPSAAAHASRVKSLTSALADPDAVEVRHSTAYRLFLDLFAGLPEADFSPDWLEQLAISWGTLRLAGGDANLCLRAACALAAHGSKELLGERSSLSALEVEILSALAAASICAADFLIELAAAHGTEIVVDDPRHPDHGLSLSLSNRIAAALADNDAGIVGLLFLRLRIGPGTLALDRRHRDALWNAVIVRTRGLLRESDTLVRMEAHGCAVILPDLKTHAQVVLAANKIAHALELPLPVLGTTIRAGFSLGAVWSPEHGRAADDLIRCGELAVEQALRQEKAVVLFDDRLLAVARQEAKIEKELTLALEDGQLSIHVQPQIDLRSGRCVGGEVLLRWTASDGAEVAPAHLLDVARRTGAGPQLTRWLMFGVCRTLAELERAGVEIRLSINLMARDVMDPELPLLVEQAINFWRVPSSRLAVELVESAMLEDPAAAAAVMRRLLDLGVTTSIDDFGIGYSSILYLRQLPLRELKIDCVFVAAMARSPQDRDIVAALIGLSHGLGLRVVAEGVEDKETFDLLVKMGCDGAQGYWIGRPMPTADFPAWVEQWDRCRA